MTTRNQTRRRAVCYHEAGHCLAIWYVGGVADWAFVPAQSREKPPLLGEVCAPQIAPDYGDWARGRISDAQAMEGIREALLCYSAGPAAQARYEKRSLASSFLGMGTSDARQCRNLLSMWQIAPEREIEECAKANRAAMKLMRSLEGWAAVQSMAEWLYDIGFMWWPKIDDLCVKAYGGVRPSRPDAMLLPANRPDAGAMMIHDQSA